MIRTPRGLIHENTLLPHGGQGVKSGEPCRLLPTDVGSRIGVLFVPTSSLMADMHFIINGEDQGPCSREIPFNAAPLYAVVDVYGSTKKVRIVQFEGGEK
jgi:neuralized-like protein 2